MRKLIFTAISLMAALSMSSAHAGYTSTKYPIVLVHGVAGFDTIGGIINYFHDVPWNLERSGAKVYTTSVSFVNSSEDRGQQLADFISGLTEDKFNLMAHSQGAPTSRVAASLVPKRIASVTSINGVNYGSKVADVIRGIIPPGSYVEGGVGAIANALGNFVDELTDSGNPQDGVAALETLTTDGTLALNAALKWKGVDRYNHCTGSSENVDIEGYNVKMFSWGGKRSWTRADDPLDVFMTITSKAFNSGENNDGLVSSCSQKMGRVLSVNYLLNHGDAVNHLFGMHHLFLDPITLYRSQANRLKNSGL